jgi:lipoate-protein ligase A
MILEILPSRTGGAAENMALDFLLLQRYPRAAAARFRHYGWHRPAFTFGYSQKIDFVRSALPPDGPFDLCRRPTGGGIVDHRDDWTFALAIPRGHPLEELRAAHSYREIHECLAAALQGQGVPAVTKKSCEPCAGASGSENGPPSGAAAIAGVCFERAELYDVVHEHTGEKIAGGAQKRNKHGLLLQGSLLLAATGIALDEERLHDDFAARLGARFAATPEPTPWPDLNEDEVSGLTDYYGSSEWIERR